MSSIYTKRATYKTKDRYDKFEEQKDPDDVFLTTPVGPLSGASLSKVKCNIQLLLAILVTTTITVAVTSAVVYVVMKIPKGKIILK